MCSPLIHSLWHTSKILTFNFLTQKLLSLSLCCRAAGDVKTYKKLFSLSLSLSSLCCVIYHHRGRSSVHSSKRVTTGPNGLQRVRTGHNGFQRVPTGLTGGGGGGKVNDTFIISPQLYYLYHLS